MITTSPHTRQNAPPDTWQRQMADAVTRLDELAAALGLDPAVIGASEKAGRQFALRVPRSYLARMRRGDPRDPLLAQVLPAAAELIDVPGFVADPVAENAALRAPSLLH